MAPFARVKTRALLPFTRSSNLSNSQFESLSIHLAPYISGSAGRLAIFRHLIAKKSPANRKDCVIRAAIVNR